MDRHPSETLRAEFNKLAGVQLPASFFHGIYGSEGHETPRRFRRARSMSGKSIPNASIIGGSGGAAGGIALQRRERRQSVTDAAHRVN